MKLKAALAAAVTAGTVLSGLALTSGPALAGTPSCGVTCVNVFQARYGTSISLGGISPQFVTDSFRQVQKTGNPVIEFRASNADPAEDFTVANEGQVSEFFAAGLVSSALAIHYGCEVIQLVSCAPGSDDLYAFEWEYAPFGADSGLCIGLAATAVQNEQVTLQPCGVSSKTLWIVDYAPFSPGRQSQIDPVGGDGVPLINGSDTNFSHPYVLTYTGEPTAVPRASVFVSNLTGFSNCTPPFNIPCGSVLTNEASLKTVADSQQWLATVGILP